MVLWWHPFHAALRSLPGPHALDNCLETCMDAHTLVNAKKENERMNVCSDWLDHLFAPYESCTQAYNKAPNER